MTIILTKCFFAFFDEVSTMIKSKMVLSQMQYLNRQTGNKNNLFFELGYNNFDRQIEWMVVGAGDKRWMEAPFFPSCSNVDPIEVYSNIVCT